MNILDKYIDQLLEKSTPQAPIWNIEKIKSGKPSTWNYIDGCMIKAILDLYAIKGDKKFLEFADSFIDYFVQEDCSIHSYDPLEYNIDNVNAGKTLFELYKLTGKEKYRKAIETIYSQVKFQPRTKEGNFWHKLIYPYQVWLDGLYMGQPFYVQYEAEFNNCENIMDSFHQFMNVYEIMREAGLRIPKPLGHAVSIVGALVIGESAVNAGFIASSTLMIVAVAAISRYVTSSLYAPITVLRFAFVAVGGIFGMWGIVLMSCFVLANICAKTSVGVPYMSSLAPFSVRRMRDVFVRADWKKLSRHTIRVQKFAQTKESDSDEG